MRSIILTNIMRTAILRFCTIILAGLLAGTSFGIWIGLNPMRYSASTYVELQQHLVQALNSLMVLLVIAATILTAVSAYIQQQDKPVFVALLVASALFTACILISGFGNLPIQKEILKWGPNAFPANWTVYRDHWWTWHIMRTIAELGAFTLVAWTLVQGSLSTQASREP